MKTLALLLLLQQAYPSTIQSVTTDTLTWANGSQLHFSAQTESPTLLDQLTQSPYLSNKMIQCDTYVPHADPGRVRNEAFFAAMYGATEEAVRANADIIYWMPLYFGNKYPLIVTRINGVNTQLKYVSNELEQLAKTHPTYLKYLDNPSGTFSWRRIQHSTQRSLHSFGIAIDLNERYTHYWLRESSAMTYQNTVPCEIVTIFENHGFIWGGKWQHYDTMHFEYRPELLQETHYNITAKPVPM